MYRGHLSHCIWLIWINCRIYPSMSGRLDNTNNSSESYSKYARVMWKYHSYWVRFRGEWGQDSIMLWHSIIFPIEVGVSQRSLRISIRRVYSQGRNYRYMRYIGYTSLGNVSEHQWWFGWDIWYTHWGMSIHAIGGIIHIIRVVQG